MANAEYPLKHIRLRQLFEAGFNIADFICFPPCQLDLEALKSFFEKHHGRISLRHFPADEYMKHATPFFPDQTDWNVIQQIATEHNSNLYCLYNEIIVPKDANFTGNIILYDDRNYEVEYFKGPGTPKDIEKGSIKNLKRFQRKIGEPIDPDAPEKLKRMASFFGNFLSTTRPIIIEFQIYPYPIGLRQTEEIVWEWRRFQ